MKNGKVIYTPAGRFVTGKNGHPIAWRTIGRELAPTRELVWQLFLRDFNGRFRQSLLGMAWAVLLPVLAIVMFVAMSQSGVINLGDTGVPYPVYALTGLTCWSLFSTGLTACASSLVNASSMLSKISFPRSSLVLAAFTQGGVEFIIRSLLTAAIFAWYGSSTSGLRLLLGLVCLVPLALFTLGLGFIVAILGGLFRDVINALNAVLAGLLLVTPVLYPLPARSLLSQFSVFNPLNHLIAFPRDLILFGASADTQGFIATAVLSPLVFCAGWRLFDVAQTRIVERL